MMSPSITRTFHISDISPQELASLFTAMFDDAQAEFFAEIGRIAKDWPGAGWCMQSCCIAGKLSDEGRAVIETLAGHALDDAGKARVGA